MTEIDPEVTAPAEAEKKPVRRTPTRKRKSESEAPETASDHADTEAAEGKTKPKSGAKSASKSAKTSKDDDPKSEAPAPKSRKRKADEKPKPARKPRAAKSKEKEGSPEPQGAPEPTAQPAEASVPTGNHAGEKASGSENAAEAPRSEERNDSRSRGRRRQNSNRRGRGHRGRRGDDFDNRQRDEPYVYRPPREGSTFGDGPGPEPEEEVTEAPPAPIEESDDPGAPSVIRYKTEFGEGVVEISGKGFGFLRDASRNFSQSPQDIFVTPEVIRKHAVRDGMWLRGEVRRGSRGLQLFKLAEIEHDEPSTFAELPMFEELTVINPIEQLKLETVPHRFTTRVIDMMTPVGKGQRGLIVAPPRTGKTTLLQHIAEAMVENHPQVKLIILLVDERPEEVTELSRAVPSAEVMASSNDSDLKSHTHIAQLAVERAKRLVEAGRDVFILLDSITRVGRAFNNATHGSGRTLSGGMDARAMEIPRRLFSAARNTEEAGSLTILGTALVDTGSRMDELIFQEFKGTGNMELVLDRRIAEQRVYPAVDIFASGTRREELLIPAHHLEKINVIRRGLAEHKPIEAIERLLSFLMKFPTNEQLYDEIPG